MRKNTANPSYKNEIRSIVQIVVPMSGFGERFRRAGYTVPKPLIVVDGKPIIQHVVEMYPGENDFTFICNQDHLDYPDYEMGEILKRICPTGKIVGITPHKLGPVHAVQQIVDQLKADKPTIVNYCDFTCYWNYQDFKNKVLDTGCDGAIPCYRGFHPHTLWSNYYAYVPEKDMWAYDIQEKTPFTDNPRQEFASSGTYYFRSAKLMDQYFNRCINEKLTVADEYYVSMVYKPMMLDALNILVYELEHFMQWGVPSDLEEYRYWSNIFKNINNDQPRVDIGGTLLLPMVGLGSRFSAEGYDLPKPLITVNGKAMATQALVNLPKTDASIFILREDLPNVEALISALTKEQPDADLCMLDHMTDGQASTCLEGGETIADNDAVTIAACDNGMLYDTQGFLTLFDDPTVDVIVWGAKGYPGAQRNPSAYGWLDVDDLTGTITNVSVKTPIGDTANTPIVVGAFIFRKMSDFRLCVESMKKREGRINGEYYVDTAINDAIALGLNCKVFAIDYYICWGTPNDLRTFKYWQICFDKWHSHPYKIIHHVND